MLCSPFRRQQVQSLAECTRPRVKVIQVLFVELVSLEIPHLSMR